MRKLIASLLAVLILFSVAVADSVFVLCQPDSFVNVRAFPRKNADIAGRVELGWQLETDGVRKNGYVHVEGFENGGWVCAGFLTSEQVTVYTFKTEILSKGRVACRRSIKGQRRRWLSDGQKVTVYAFAGDWSITNQGFIQTQYLGGLCGK